MIGAAPHPDPDAPAALGADGGIDRASPDAREGTGAIFECRFPANDATTRSTLIDMRGHLVAAGLQEALIDTVELVLAEVLNNITEHAYRPGAGQVALRLDLQGDAIQCHVTDQGAPMPGGTLPEGALPDPAAEGRLPEGGWGWFLVRTLAVDLQYERKRGVNCLRLRVPLGTGG